MRLIVLFLSASKFVFNFELSSNNNNQTHVNSNKFTEHDLYIAREAIHWNIPVVAVRNKANQAFESRIRRCRRVSINKSNHNQQRLIYFYYCVEFRKYKPRRNQTGAYYGYKI